MNTPSKLSTVVPEPNKRPSQSRDSAGFTWSTVIKITDPKSGQVLLHTRGE